MTTTEPAASHVPDVVIVGATHPHAGGVAQHNTRLAHELADRGAAVRVESWKSQYPRGARNGLGVVPRDKPELAPVADVVEKLAWYSPWSWFALIFRIRNVPAVVFAVVGPPHAVMYAMPLLGIRRRQRFAIVHNVLPHERGAIDRFLMRWLLRRMQSIVVHSEEQKQRAVELGVDPRRIEVSALPSPGLGLERESISGPPRLRDGSPLQLLFFGMVRHYKGLDLLIRALVDVPEARLVVAGHFWEPVDLYADLARELDVHERVELRPGYVATDEIDQLFADSDVLVLPYRHGTASIVTDVAFEHGRCVVVSDVGTLAHGVVESGVGLVVTAEDVPALAGALREVSQPDTLQRLTESVVRMPARDEERWKLYVEALDRARAV